MENKIVVLDNGKQYCILNETSFKDNRYCCAVEYFEDKEELGEDYVVFEEDMNGSSLVLNLIDDKELEDYILLKIASENDELDTNK
jgi:hypothetical protein